MRSTLIRFGLIFFIVYASFFGGVVENNPLLKVIHQIAGAALIAGWLLSLVWRKRSFPITRLNWPLWALGISWGAAGVFGSDPRVSFEFVWVTFFHIILFFILIDLMQNGRTLWVFEGLFITGGLVVMLGALEMVMWYFALPPLSSSRLGWPDIAGYTVPPAIHELSVPLNYNNPTGAYAIVLIPLVLAGSSTVTQADLRWGLRVLAAGLLAVAIFTQSRGAYLGLVAMLGLMGLLWLLRPEIRAKFPHRVQPLIAPRVLLVLAGVGTLLAVLVLYQIFVEPSHPNPNDVTRISIWYSATRMFEDHPLAGVGPFQFKGQRLNYGNWDFSYHYLPLNHPHNLFFTVLSEGGILLLLASAWVLVRLGRIGWAAWREASPQVRRRLEASLVMLATFGVHNMVDTFLQTQLMIPVLIVVAYVVSQDSYKDDARVSYRLAERLQMGGTVAALVVGQAIFIPLDLGALRQNQFLNQYNSERYTTALDTIRSAQKADPWMDLYVLEEANLLGRLAYDDPDTYLEPAIRALTESTESVPTWDVGWHNLAAMYALAGDYDRAVEYEATARQRNPAALDYAVKLGEYNERLGNWAAAEESYAAALERWPWFAASAFWASPERTALLNRLVAQEQEPARLVDLYVYSGQSVFPAIDSPGADVQFQLEAWWPDESETPCLYCYYVRSNPELLEAERLLHRDSLTLEQREQVRRLADKAIFLDGTNAAWGWYILARLENLNNTREVRQYLARAVGMPVDFRLAFPGIYRVQGELAVLPQARTAVLPPVAYEPWLKLVDLEQQAGQKKEAQEVMDDLRLVDSYLGIEP